MTSLADAVAAHPLPEFANWWPLSDPFVAFMANAIGSTWSEIAPDSGLEQVATHAQEYGQVIYGRALPAQLAKDFLISPNRRTFQSGEFDALSYAFYLDAFEQLAAENNAELAERRRQFTRRVGERFFGEVAKHLDLELPEQLRSAHDFDQLELAIDQVGSFLQTQGYLRDHFRFHFDVNIDRPVNPIQQDRIGFRNEVRAGKTGYALYEMGFPIILPSAVYLYNTVGEAQHHSSRTIEELFARVGCTARETDDFDPSEYPADLVIELWTIEPAETTS